MQGSGTYIVHECKVHEHIVFVNARFTNRLWSNKTFFIKAHLRILDVRLDIIVDTKYFILQNYICKLLSTVSNTCEQRLLGQAFNEPCDGPIILHP